VCVCVCVCVCLCVCVCVKHTHRHAPTHTHTHTHTHERVSWSVTGACAHPHTCTHRVKSHLNTHTHTHTHRASPRLLHMRAPLHTQTQKFPSVKVRIHHSSRAAPMPANRACAMQATYECTFTRSWKVHIRVSNMQKRLSYVQIHVAFRRRNVQIHVSGNEQIRIHALSAHKPAHARTHTHTHTCTHTVTHTP